MRFNSFGLLFALAVATLATKGAYADTLFVSCSASTTMTVSMASPNTTGAVTCPQFNGNLGTLTEAVFFSPAQMTVLSGSTFSIKNTGTATIPSSVGSIFGINLNFTFGPYPDGRIDPAGNSPVTAPSAAIAAGSTVTFAADPGNPVFFPSSADVFNTPASLQSIAGNGTFTIPLLVKSTDQTFNNYSTEQLTNYSVSFYLNPAPVLSVPNPPIVPQGTGVFFTFTPAALQDVPEPANMVLFGGATLALFGWKRLRAR